MTTDEQLAEWLQGNPLHNTERDECCPDFSCCEPSMLADEPVRRAFVEGDEQLRLSMCWTFLAEAMSKMTEKNVYMAGGNEGEKH